MQPISQNSNNSDKLVTELLEIMKQLRDKDNGCPWDKNQTSESLSQYILQEACSIIISDVSHTNTSTLSIHDVFCSGIVYEK